MSLNPFEYFREKIDDGVFALRTKQYGSVDLRRNNEKVEILPYEKRSVIGSGQVIAESISTPKDKHSLLLIVDSDFNGNDDLSWMLRLDYQYKGGTEISRRFDDLEDNFIFCFIGPEATIINDDTQNLQEAAEIPGNDLLTCPLRIYDEITIRLVLFDDGSFADEGTEVDCGLEGYWLS